jgi:Carboxypeptidase regulatory-like domain
MVFLKTRLSRLRKALPSIGQRSLARLLVMVTISLILSPRAPAQTAQPPQVQLGRVMGTVTDVRGDAVVGATVVIAGPEKVDRRTVVTNENGFFEFDHVKPGGPYQIIVTAAGFVDWTSPLITLAPGQFELLGDIQLLLATQHTAVRVIYNPVHAATEQLEAEEGQRILGIIPNFYVTYDPNAEPLTTKMKFELALKVSIDPVTLAGIALVSGVKQAANTPNYGQGAEGFGKRFGATAADGFTDIMIGGAILPSLLHEDPRYFYQGTGTTKSRIWHAITSPFVSKRDNGSWGPNYSSLGGDLASSAIANLYYPRSNRGAGLVFSQFGIATAERVGAGLAQEFLLSKLTRRGGHMTQSSRTHKDPCP